MKKLLSLALAFSILTFATAAFAGGVISFNKATVKQLMSIESVHIPQKLATSIVNYRKKHGAFRRSSDLLKVPGMTQDFLEELNPQDRKGDVIFDPNAEPTLAPSKC